MLILDSSCICFLQDLYTSVFGMKGSSVIRIHALMLAFFSMLALVIETLDMCISITFLILILYNLHTSWNTHKNQNKCIWHQNFHVKISFFFPPIWRGFAYSCLATITIQSNFFRRKNFKFFCGYGLYFLVGQYGLHI